jgi:acyl-CoA synthetase (AMP-forming)/AMP-acid ligase II
MIFKSRFPEVSWADQAITQAVFRHADRLTDRVAITDGVSGRSYTYGQMRSAVRRVAAGLEDRGLRSGDAVAILSPNLPEYPIAFHGACTAGLVNTTLNPLYTPEEINFQLRDSSARMLITIPQLLDKARAAAAGSSVEEIVVFGDAPAGAPGTAGDATPGATPGGTPGEALRVTPFASLLAGREAEQAPIDPAEDLAVLPYSSGTTGVSKGVMLTHRNLVSNLYQVEVLQDLQEDDVILAVLPFFHIYGMNVVMNATLFGGASLVSLPRFELDSFLEAIQRHRVTWLYVVPPIVIAFAKHPSIGNYDLSSVRVVFSGAAPLDAQTAEEAAQRIGCAVIQGYGLTETSPVTHSVPRTAKDAPPAAVGYALPNTECKVVSPGGEELGPNQDGEILIRGPQVMTGYLANDEATAATIDDDRFLHTGDIGHVDEHGWWYVVDRLKELIKYKGLQVPPAELEAVLLSHPAVADAGVIGVADPEAGEIPKGFVVLKQEADPEEIMAFVAQRVAPHKKLRQLEVIDEIPKSASGKILRRVLRDRQGSEAP